VLLATAGQSLLVDLNEGAGIGAWDLRASRVALASVVRRRPEAYHQTLIDHERHEADRAVGAADTGAPSAGAAAEHSAPKTIHDIVTVKEQGLSALLVYDRHERRGGLVHVLAPGGDPATSGPESLAADRVAEWSDFADGPWDVVALAPASLEVRREARITGAADPCRLEVTKRVTLGGDRRSPSLSLEILVRNSGSAHVVADLGLSWPFDLMGGGANPAAYYETTSLGGDPITTPHDGTGDLTAADRLTFGNRDAGVRVDVRLDTPGRLTWYPVETVSNSEAGFERVYQGSSLLIRWPLALAAGASVAHRVGFQVTQDRDLREEDLADPAAVESPAVVPTPA